MVAVYIPAIEDLNFLSKSLGFKIREHFTRRVTCLSGTLSGMLNLESRCILVEGGGVLFMSMYNMG